MSNEWDEFDDNTQGDQGEGPKALRDALKQEKKERARLADELAALRSSQRERAVKDVLTSTGVNPAIAKFIPSEVSDEKAVSEWLTENGSLFGYQPQQATEQQNPAPTGNAFNFAGTVTPPPQGVMSADHIQALAAINDAATGGTPPTAEMQALAQIQQAGSVEELTRLLGNG